MDAKILPLHRSDRNPDPPDDPDAEPTPTRLEHAKYTTPLLHVEDSMDEDPVRIALMAWKAARVLELAVKGLTVDYVINPPEVEDLEMVGEFAGSLTMLCDQAKRLMAVEHGTEPWTAPEPKGGSR